MTDPSSRLEDLLQLGRKSFSPDRERLESVHAALGAKVAALSTATAAAGWGHALRSTLWGTPTRLIASCVFVGAAATGTVALTVSRTTPQGHTSPVPVVASTPTTVARVVAVPPGSTADWVPAAPFVPLVSAQSAPPEPPGPAACGAGRPHHVRPAFPGAGTPIVDRASPWNDVARPIEPSSPGDVVDTTATAPALPTATGTARANGSIDPVIAAVQKPAPSVAMSPAQDNLAGEVAALSAARLALHKGDAARALSILDAYATLHPRGTLDEERLATRILALCALGRSSEARTGAQSLERLAPSSPQWVTIDASCAGRGTLRDR